MEARWRKKACATPPLELFYRKLRELTGKEYMLEQTHGIVTYLKSLNSRSQVYSMKRLVGKDLFGAAVINLAKTRVLT